MNTTHLPCRTTTPLQIIALRLLPVFAAPFLLCQCGSTNTPALGKAESYLDATPGRENRDRITGQRIVSVNGKKVSKSEARIPAGLAEVAVTFQWPQGGQSTVPLQFYAAKGAHHIVDYAAYPHDGRRADPDFGNFNRGMIEAGAQMEILGAPLIGVAMVAGTAKFAAGALAHGIPDGTAATHVDVSVISSNPADGIVRVVRAFPDGKVETRAWDRFAKMKP